MRKIILFIAATTLMCNAFAQSSSIKISKAVLQDKIKGGWAGQTIGVTFGGPYEFRFNGTFIGDYQKLMWHDGLIKDNMLNNAGLYDDLYMDLTFVDVFEKYGLDAPVDSFANAFAHAGYMLWHANQAGRYNILHGIKAPLSGYWKNNPHADCIDYQIESDFSGLMSPAMPNTAAAIGDNIGHIMNYGDGWYGGVFVGAMYTQTFISSDINFIIDEALGMIPQQSEFYQCIHDVIGWHKQFPGDWKQTWFAIQKKWANDVGCPEGVFVPFNIDAKVNAAYVVTGLLYGDKDFTKTLEITARCGQDADCNPSTVAGILGALLGYDKIPAYWKQGLKESEDIDFKYTTMSLNNVYAISFKHALQNIQRNGGSVDDNSVTIKAQQPAVVKFEKSFEDLYPVAKIPVQWNDEKNTISFKYEGTGFVLRGECAEWNSNTDFIFHSELYVDGKLIEKPELPANFTMRRHELCWNYDLPKGDHTVQLKILNVSDKYSINNVEAIYYTNKPIDGMKKNEAEAKAVK
jgi:hypothetical protein